ncbi:PQQ-binding-like beta-propeller repeat protein [Methylobacter sp. BlB1]|uniref:PQQ-binding-like beta-propeller repeat protein n=1 Tax=Methylobacter sp. BlB1 TaxID=2785914 RepID=UPI001893942B|nr:PQQ-binding-like beta-propeller repeat protein [Methylobacter sp. BlB1]MBF6649852.1 PQQ-binding-like beta-propeller repeat protein [Methylobacter sp. BlB1]
MCPGFQSNSRPAPPVVAPIERNGIRYEQDMQSYDHGGDQPGGYLTAIDVKTGERLWMVKVYEVSDQSESGVDSIGIYFKSMALIPGRDALEIEDETGRRFIFDLINKTSDQVSETLIDTLGPIKIPQ